MMHLMYLPRKAFLGVGAKISGGDSMKVRCYVVFLSLAILLLLLPAAWAQSSLSTGSIQGTVTDPHDAVVPGANVTITNKATGQSIKATTSGSGTFSSGALQPATYEVRVEAS